MSTANRMPFGDEAFLQSQLRDAMAFARTRGLQPSMALTIAGPLSAEPASPSRQLSAADALGERFEQHRASNPTGRKQSGTFFTPPKLAAAVTDAALEPWIGTGSSLRSPADLLTLRLVDPAAGGGAFVLAALRRLADALDRSLRQHRWIDEQDRATHRMPAGFAARWDSLAQRPDRRTFALAVSCVHGVDLDPTAITILKLSVWLAVGHPQVEVEDLARRFRCGNALLGAWPQPRQTPPRRAWQRDAGDRTHRGVHHQRGDRSRKIRGVDSPKLATGPELDPDTWCAYWFWPIDELDATDPASERHAAIVRDVTARHRFFHWDQEFPDAFAEGGFDVVLGNPPWDVHKPDSRTFFAGIDPDYRRYSKQAALTAQQELFTASPDLERRWLDHLADLAAFRQFIRCSNSPYRFQGTAEPNSYKLFVELGHALLKPGGRLALVVPASLYTDLGAKPLRTMLLESGHWERLIGFENRARLFPDVDARFKFCVLIHHRRMGRHPAEPLRASFMQTSVDTIQNPCAAQSVRVDATTIRRFSPETLGLCEFTCQQDVDILDKLLSNGVRFDASIADGGWGLDQRREFDMTLDSHRFLNRETLEAGGWVSDRDSAWIYTTTAPVDRLPSGSTCRDWVPLLDGRWVPRAAVQRIARPLYEGRMIAAFDYCAKGWTEGRGRMAKWRDREPGEVRAVRPQFLIDERDLDLSDLPASRVAFMAIGSATNSRTMIATMLRRGDPCGNSVPTLRCPNLESAVALTAVLNSLVYDWALRLRLCGNNLNRFVLADTPLPRLADTLRISGFTEHVAALNWNHERFAEDWSELLPDSTETQHRWLVDCTQRRQARAWLDAAVAHAFNLSEDDLAWILRDCDRPIADLARHRKTQDTDPKGFWRLDAKLDPADRLPRLALDQFRRLSSPGPLHDSRLRARFE